MLLGKIERPVSKRGTSMYVVGMGLSSDHGPMEKIEVRTHIG